MPLPVMIGAAKAAKAIGGRLRRKSKRRAGRPRRRTALTNADLRIMHEISTSISKKAAESFINQRVRRG